MKIVFLDVDGVVCLYPEWQKDWGGNRNDRLSELCCKKLKEILDATGAKLVITSSWRIEGQDLDNLIWQLEKHGVSRDYIIGQTADLRTEKSIKTHNELRWLEIKDYIDKHGIANYIILDDFNLEKFDKPHLIRTKMHFGLTEKLKDVCINKLNN